MPEGVQGSEGPATYEPRDHGRHPGLSTNQDLPAPGLPIRAAFAAASIRTFSEASLRSGRSPTRSISETISIAVTAASKPLLPALVPALSIACSIVSVVITPKTIGRFVSRATAEIPLEKPPPTQLKGAGG